jgi:MinD-like ATPase involved in chromosome partitioning or flagellar assembly
MAIQLVVGGASGLAARLEQTGLFTQVHRVESTGQMKALVASGVLKVPKGEIAFLFADSLTVDTPGTSLDALLAKLSRSGYAVIVLGTSPRGADLVAAAPNAGLVEGPFTVNLILGTIAGTGVAQIPPLADGFTTIDVFTGDLDLPASPDTVRQVQFQPDTVTTPPATTPPVTAPPVTAPPVTATSEASGSSASSGSSAASRPWYVATSAEPDKPAAPVYPQPNVMFPPPSNPTQAAPVSPVTAHPVPVQSAPANGWSTPPADSPPLTMLPPPNSSPLVSLPAPTGIPLVGGMTPTSLPPAGASPLRPLVPTNSAWSEAPQAGAYTAEVNGARRRTIVLAVGAAKGGVGKSTLSLSLAVRAGLRLRGQGSVALIDCNYGQADIGRYMQVFDGPTVMDVVRDRGLLSRDRLREAMVHRPELNVHVLRGPATAAEGNPQWLNARLYRQILDSMRGMFNVVVLDLPVAEKYLDMYAGFALAESDFIVVPVNPNVATLLAVDSWLSTICEPEIAGGNGMDDRKVGIVLNRTKQGIDCDEQDVRLMLARWRFLAAIPDSDAWQRANNNGEILAAGANSDLNEALDEVLFQATGMDVFHPTVEELEPKRRRFALLGGKSNKSGSKGAGQAKKR